MSGKTKIVIIKNGPYEVTSDVPLNRAAIGCNDQGESVEWVVDKKYETGDGKTYNLCRCGQSRTKPFCDGAHMDCEFRGRETAERPPYAESAGRLRGAEVDLLDDDSLCVGARFCDPQGTIWKLIEFSDDPAVRETVIRMAGDCPAGRLTIIEKDGTMIEPELPREISLVEDPINNFRGPLWVKGGIEIEGADGEKYEVRNRVALCRCGESENMPFCDAAHYNCPHMQGLDE